MNQIFIKNLLTFEIYILSGGYSTLKCVSLETPGPTIVSVLLNYKKMLKLICLEPFKYRTLINLKYKEKNVFPVKNYTFFKKTHFYKFFTNNINHSV